MQSICYTTRYTDIEKCILGGLRGVGKWYTQIIDADAVDATQLREEVHKMLSQPLVGLWTTSKIRYVACTQTIRSRSLNEHSYYQYLKLMLKSLNSYWELFISAVVHSLVLPTKGMDYNWNLSPAFVLYLPAAFNNLCCALYGVVLELLPLLMWLLMWSTEIDLYCLHPTLELSILDLHWCSTMLNVLGTLQLPTHVLSTAFVLGFGDICSTTCCTFISYTVHYYYYYYKGYFFAFNNLSSTLVYSIWSLVLEPFPLLLDFSCDLLRLMWWLLMYRDTLKQLSALNGCSLMLKLLLFISAVVNSLVCLWLLSSCPLVTSTCHTGTLLTTKGMYNLCLPPLFYTSAAFNNLCLQLWCARCCWNYSLLQWLMYRLMHMPHGIYRYCTENYLHPTLELLSTLFIDVEIV